jgi:TP901 family phage tail tape measure protein
MADNQNLVAKIIINAQDNASKAFDGIRENAGKLAAVLATVLSVDFFKSAVDSAADFEEQLTITGVKAGATSEDLLKLKTAAVEIGNEFGKTGTESLKGLEIIASAGYKTEESISLLAPAFALADNSGKTLAESSSYLIKIMQSLGLETKQAGNVTDILTVASSQANTKVGDLTDALLESGGTAKTFGLDIKDTAAILDVLAGAGKSGAEAGTALRNILLQVSDPSSKAQESFQKLGIHSTDLVTVFKELATKGQAGKDALLALNTGDIAAANGILANIGSYDRLRGGLEGIDGAAKKASDALGENFKAAYEDLGALWSNLKTQLGTPILEPFKIAVVGVQGKIKELTDSGIIDKIGQSLAEAFKIASMAVGEFVKTVDFTTIGEKIKSFTVATIQTFQEINTGVQATANFFSLFGNTVSTVFNGLQAGAAILESAVTATFGGMNKIIGQVATGWGEIFLLMPGFEKVGSSLKGMGEYMTQSGNAAIEFAKNLKDEAGKQLEEAGKSANKVQTAFTALADSAKDSVPKLDSIWQVSNTIKDALNGTTTASNNAAQANQTLANSTKETATAVDTTAQKVNAHTTAIYHYVDAMGQSHFADAQNAAGKNAVAVAIEGVKGKTDNLAKSIVAIPNKETTITANTKQPEEKIAELKKDTESKHEVKPDNVKATEAIVENKKATDSLHTINSDSSKPANDIATNKLPTESLHTIKVDNSQPESAISYNQQPTSSTHTIYVNTVKQPSGYQFGGEIQHFATGGTPTFSRREGGLGGFGGGDTVPAMLEPGEWIIKKESVKKYGNGFMAKLNAGQIQDVPRFATGGQIGSTTNTVQHFSTGGEVKPAQISQNQTITIKFELPNGKSAQGDFSKADSTNLISILQEAAMRGLPANIG